MARRAPIEIFMPPNILKAKAGSAAGGIDGAAIKRAEAAMEMLKIEFQDWLAADVAKLVASRDRYVAAPTAAARDELFRATLDIKGQGETFGFPMIARVASSLTHLIEGIRVSAEVPLGLADAHVAAIKVIFRDNVRTTTDKITCVLAEELEARVSEEIAG